MKISSTKFKGLKIFQGKTHLNSRGTFREMFLKNKKRSLMPTNSSMNLGKLKKIL